MAQVVKKDIDKLNSTLTVSIAPEDYLPKVNKELNNYRKKAQLKGFRKGKTPMNFIKKMYGKSVLADAVNNILQDEVYSYLTKNKLNILGQPLPSDEQENIDFELSSNKTYDFNFDIGLAPEFEIKGFDSSNEFDYLKAKIEEEKIDEVIEDIRKRAGNRKSTDEAIEENDVVALNVEELEGDNTKENGWAATFNVLVSDISDKYRDEFIGKRKGEKVRFDVYELEKDKTAEHVEKYLLQIQENDDNPEIGRMFEGTIADVTRLAPAEINEEFFEKVFPNEGITTLEAAKEKIKTQMSEQYDSQSDAILFRQIQDDLLEKNDVELPDAFLRKLITYNNPETTQEAIDKDFDKVKDNLKWSLIKEKVRNSESLDVSEEEILSGFKDRVRGYFGGYGDELIILNTANRLMEDKNQVNQMYEELLSEKVFGVIKEKVKLNVQEVSTEELANKLEEFKNKMETPQANNEIEEAEVVSEEQE